MLKAYTKQTVCLLLLLLTSYKTIALDKLSHQAVCQLAYNNLPLAKQTRIKQLLRHIPIQHQQLINNYLKTKGTITFAKSCVWADAIKKWPEYHQYKPWHYLNVNRKTTNISSQEITKNCQKGCITTAIIKHKEQLQQSQQPWDKAQALMFLGHWLGDIHQPLHISFANDRGGNAIKIRSATKCKNLHWFWDECLLKTKTSSITALIAELQIDWQKNYHEIPQSSPLAWANDSFKITTSAAMGYCQTSKNGCLKNKQPLTITKAYIDHFYPIFTRQLTVSAMRLHQQLAAIDF